MYCKVLIIEDEYIMRQGIRHLIEWEKEGYRLVGEASNGEEGLAMAEAYQPDIILADIVMPVLDGMELSLIMKKRFPHIKLIMLSSYDDFEYVKKTLLNGACDYILKPSLNPQILTGVLDQAAALIPGMCIRKHSGVSMKEKLNHFLGGGKADLTEGDFKKRFPFTKCCLLLSKGNIGQTGTYEDTAGRVRLLNEYWQQQKAYESEVLLIGREVCAVLLNYRIRDEEEILREVRRCILKVNCCYPDSFWIYGDTFDSLAGLEQSYKQTLSLAGLQFYYKGVTLLCAADSRKCKEAEQFSYERYAGLLCCQNFAEALKQLEAYVTSLCDCTMEEYLLKNTAKTLIYHFLLEKEKADGEMCFHRSELFRKIDHSRYLEDFQFQFARILEDLYQKCEETVRKNDNFEQIKYYIKENYAQDLELGKIAKKFNYNYNYLSTCFNKNMNESFSEYLNRIRIEKACEILRSTSCSIARISEMVGYSDPSYFSRIFKSQMGRTPSQWKRRNAAMHRQAPKQAEP